MNERLIIEVCDLSAGYDGNPVLRGVTIRLMAGESLGVLGANGSGKSTLLKAILGLLRPTAGEITLEGHPIGFLSARERARRIAYLPQNAEPRFAFTIREMVETGRYAHVGALSPFSKQDRDAVENALRVADLLHLADRPAAEVSGGEWQRALLARALAQEADLLLLDEPTSHLDLFHQRQLLQALERHRLERGGAVIAVHHDFNQAAESCDRLIVLNGGKIVLEGTPRKVLEPEALGKVLGVPLICIEHPDTGRPLLIPAGSPRTGHS